MRPLAAALVVALLAVPAFAEVKVGDAAPDFTLKDQDGKDVKLSSFKGQKNVIVAFYPHDFSGGCITEMKCLIKEMNKLAARDAVVVGISVDTVESHANFAKTLGIQFRILSDTDLAVAKLYDVATPSPDGAYATRSAFIVDKDGKIRWLDRDLKAPKGTLEGSDVLAALDKIAGKADPVAALADLPPVERDGKTVFVRFAQAFLAEDIVALEALVDKEACGKPGETSQMQRDRRKALMDRWRTLFDKNDLKTLKFDDVVDVRGSRAYSKDTLTPETLTGYGADSRDMATRLADGEILVIGRTTAPKLAEGQVMAREVVMRIKKTGDAWKILEIVAEK
jgi:peroxiredoxin Q/BCP